MLSVYGLFKPSYSLELGLNSLREQGFADKKLLVIPLNNVPPYKQKVLDSMQQNDGMSLVDGISICASIGMLMGVIYGNMVYIGPIALGLMGAFAGGGVGFLLDRAIHKKKNNGPTPPSGEIIVAVHCNSEEEASTVESIFLESRAVAIGRALSPFKISGGGNVAE